jgi:hypothetical protein
LIVGVLGLLYATIRSMGLGQAMAAIQFVAAHDVQFNRLQRLLIADAVDPGPANNKALTRMYVDLGIAGMFVALLYVICLFRVFTKL